MSIKSECLERMLFFGEPSLRRAVAEFIHHYHGERNHQRLGNTLLEAEESVGSPYGKVRCRKRLGGLLSYYHRARRVLRVGYGRISGLCVEGVCLR